MKFGGTSVATAERWQTIIQQMQRCQANGERPCVVVSAVTTVTNRMSDCINEALRNIQPSEPGCAFQQVKEVHLKLIAELGLNSLAEDSNTPNASFYVSGLQVIHGLLDDLEQLLNGVRLTREESDPSASPRIHARISAFGELLSSQIGLLAIRSAGVPCVRLDSRRLLTSTESTTQQSEDSFLEANVDPLIDAVLVIKEITRSCKELSSVEGGAPSGYAATCGVITQGFIASTPKGSTCLLGRGGSDTSAALLAALFDAKRLEIWTDVHGLFTSDPRHVSNTRLIRDVSYRVAQELASMGAKVLHPRCLIPAAWAGIPVEIHNTNDPMGPFSTILRSELAPTPLELDRERQEIENASPDGYHSPVLSPASRAASVAASVVAGGSSLELPSLSLATEASHVMVSEKNKKIYLFVFFLSFFNTLYWIINSEYCFQYEVLVLVFMI